MMVTTPPPQSERSQEPTLAVVRKIRKIGLGAAVRGKSSRIITWAVPAMWAVLGLLLLSLIALAVFLLFKLNIFSGQELGTEQFKSLWAFLGVALGAVVTLIGTLLTEQHNRRTESQTSEAAAREVIEKEKQDALAKQAEHRLTLDTVTKTLELIAKDGQYAEAPQIAGAIVTMMELGKTTIALRVLSKLWAIKKVDTTTAVWLIERILKESGTRANKEDQVEAATLLGLNASKLVPTKADPDQDWTEWPQMLVDSWPSHLPSLAKNALQVMAIRVLRARDLEYWRTMGTCYPVSLLFRSLDDEEYSYDAAFVLTRFLDLGILANLGITPSEDDLQRIRSKSESITPHPWFVHCVEEFDRWAKGEEINQPATTHRVLVP